ncbi:guanylate kinase [Rhodococcus ruber]|nr:guanylate kinase [Rhodococcus ruber]
MSDSGSTTRRGRLVVLAGPSAVGKSTVVRRLRSRVPDLLFSVSATTRDPRPGEVNGVDYHFVSRDEFDRMIESGDLLEWAEIHGGLQRSGTPAGPVRDALASGRPVLVEVDLTGARSVRAAMPEAVLAFLAPPSWDVLVARLTGRGTESDEVVRRRLETARTELDARDEFDTVIVNEDVDRACDELVSLLVGPRDDRPDRPQPITTLPASNPNPGPHQSSGTTQENTE